MLYEFASKATPTFATAIDCVVHDPELSVSKRRTIPARLRQLVRWQQQANGICSGATAAELPFDPSHIEALAKKLNPATLTKKLRKSATGGQLGRPISTKTFNNAFSDARFVLRRYWPAPRWTWPETPDVWKPLTALITDRYERMASKRLFSFIAAHGIGPGEVSQDVVEHFIAAVGRDPRVGDAQFSCRRALRIWNKLVARHPQVWPQVRLRMPWRRVVWAKPWSYFPPALEAEVDAFLAPPTRGILFGKKQRPKLSPSTIRTQKEALRCVVSVLERDGVKRQELGNLRSLCTPDRFERAIERLAERAGGVTYWVEKCARVLLKIAKYSGVLDPAEILAVKKAHEDHVAVAFAEWRSEQVDRDQELLNKLDDGRLIDALLQLPAHTLSRVLASKLRTRGTAYAVQRALILSLWSCAPLRVGNLLGLRLDSFSRITIDGTDWVALSVPGHEVKNSEALEHFLDDDTADLLDLYLRDYRPLIASLESPWLFPGPSGQPKTYQTLRVQMRNYIARGIRLEGFHPHVIRKIMVKLIFDLDPNALEVLRRSGGWKSDITLRRAYMQRRQRSSQAKYVQLLEERRLQAFRPHSPRKLKS